MEAGGGEALGGGVEGARDDVCGEDVGGVGVWVAEEVGEGDGGEGVVVGVGCGVEFDHCGRWVIEVVHVIEWGWLWSRVRA